ncbi:flagellar biosynthesis protein FlgE [Gallaecimonas kandeliae]|uniref:flagellar biosynthesis protein FlgE n=1 Tax=Gallaecimonas kandeliae TaxID=3029055 RepID=UPI00264A196E|nr:flagellar biosynthesis protein FlgE [Gallaecimonas kandeliae]WKE65874.1 flagellar biosynthesis protein FlgE [Gallaecimonas kandeliae]
MTSTSAIQSGINLQLTAQQRASDAAYTLARGNVDVEPLMQLEVAKQESGAAAKVIKTADEMLGTIIDTTA